MDEKTHTFAPIPPPYRLSTGPTFTPPSLSNDRLAAGINRFFYHRIGITSQYLFLPGPSADAIAASSGRCACSLLFFPPRLTNISRLQAGGRPLRCLRYAHALALPFLALPASPSTRSTLWRPLRRPSLPGQRLWASTWSWQKKLLLVRISGTHAPKRHSQGPSPPVASMRLVIDNSSSYLPYLLSGYHIEKLPSGSAGPSRSNIKTEVE